MPHRQQLRRARSISLHESIKTVIESPEAKKTGKIPAPFRRNITRSLIDLKRNRKAYDFGPVQLRALDALISSARRAKTTEELNEVYRKTCIFGLPKH